MVPLIIIVFTQIFQRIHEFMSLKTSFVFMQMTFNFSQTKEPHIIFGVTHSAKRLKCHSLITRSAVAFQFQHKSS